MVSEEVILLNLALILEAPDACIEATQVVDMEGNPANNWGEILEKLLEMDLIEDEKERYYLTDRGHDYYDYYSKLPAPSGKKDLETLYRDAVEHMGQTNFKKSVFVFLFILALVATIAAYLQKKDTKNDDHLNWLDRDKATLLWQV